jgi:L-ascorbate metabolism protein UlaG (beta-lactamase superfamily)
MFRTRTLIASLCLPLLLSAAPAFAQNTGKLPPKALPIKKPAPGPKATPTSKAAPAVKTVPHISPKVFDAIKNQPIKITWYGHATFLLESASGTRVVIDPYFKDNPSTPDAAKDLSLLKPDAIVVTHSHDDHSADLVPLAKASGAKVIGVYDLVGSLDIPDAQKAGGNVGGEFKVKELSIHLVPAMHSSEHGGRPIGVVVTFAGGRSVYHTGDTWIFGDMSLIEEIHHPEIVLLQAGGGPFNQNPAVAKMAIDKFFKPKAVVPMHFGTWPILADEAAVKAAFGADDRLKVLKPGVAQAL